MSVKHNLIFITFLFLLAGLSNAWGFDCNGDSGWSGSVQTRIVTVDASVFSSSGASIDLTMGDTEGFYCQGNTSTYNDLMIITNISYNSALATSNGITNRKLIVSGSTYNETTTGATIWPRYAQYGAYPYMYWQWTSPITITLTGRPTASIVHNTDLVTISLVRYGGGYANEARTIIFRLNGTTQNKTCNVTDYDTQVVLPAVQKNKLTSVTGRYNDISKPLNLTLKCDQVGTKVSVKFTGTAMSSTDNVLKNEWSGNDNVGFQLMFNGNPVKLNDTLQVITSSTNTSQQLTFDTHYYYRGSSSAVTAGAIKSSAEFLFTYQ